MVPLCEHNAVLPVCMGSTAFFTNAQKGRIWLGKVIMAVSFLIQISFSGSRIMKFNSKTRYGIRAMIEIASSVSGDTVMQKDISAHQGISVKYLDHIIHALKVAGLIVNSRGRKSGYQLARPATEISMYDIHNAFEPGICIVDCVSQTCAVCDGKKGCSTKIFWTRLNRNIVSFMRQVTLQNLLDKDLAGDTDRGMPR